MSCTRRRSSVPYGTLPASGSDTFKTIEPWSSEEDVQTFPSVNQ